MSWRPAAPARLLPLAAIALLSVAAYANAPFQGFAFDDEHLIARNVLLERLDRIPTLFLTHYWAGTPVTGGRVVHGGSTYRPLTLTTYALNRAVGGLEPAGYHLVNMAIHGAVSVALLALARALGATPAGAFAAAAVFAVHPIHTEAVTGVVGRAELLMALGVLLAVLLHLRALRAGQPRWTLTAGACAAFAGGLLSKEQAVVLVPLLPLVDLAAGHSPRSALRASWRRWGAHALVLAGYLVLRAAALGRAVPGAARGLVPFEDNPLTQIARSEQVLTALAVAGRYLWLCVWPRQLTADYSYAAIPLASSILDPRVVGGVLAWGALLALGVRAFVRGRGLAGLAVALTVLPFLPASNLLLPIGTIMGERLFYLPSAGLCLLAGLAWGHVWARARRPGATPWARRAAGVALGVVLALLAARALVRNRDWRDSETLMRSAARVVPRSAKVHANIAKVSADPAEVIREAEVAMSIYPAYRDADRDLLAVYGAALLRAGRPGDAIDPLARAVRLGSRDVVTHANLGLALLRTRRWPDAEAAYRGGLAVAPHSVLALNGLSLALRAQERWREALEAAAQAVRLDPLSAEGHLNLARAAEALGDRPAARDAYRRALALRPDLSVAREGLGRLETPRP